jgi:hypothetical protein
MVATLDGPAPFQLLNTASVGYGVATLYLGPVRTAMPADSINMGVSWSTGIPAWVPVGLTASGITYGWNPTTNDLTAEETPLPVAILMSTSDFPITATFEEDVLANIKYAFGVGSIVTTAAGAAGVVGKSVYTLGTLLTPMALGIEYANPTGHWTRISVPSVVSVGQVTVNNNRASALRQYAATFRATCLPSAITITYKTAESTS